MDEKEVLYILQHYRHDVANELQVIYGYLSMGKTKDAIDKMNQLFQSFHEERKLMQLAASKFALWITRSNSMYDHARLTYTIHIENKNLSEWDDLLFSRCKQVMEYLNSRPDNYYNIHLNIKDDDERIVVEMLLTGNTDNLEISEKDFDFDLQIKESEGLILRFII